MICYGARKYVSSASTGGGKYKGSYESETTDSEIIRSTGPPRNPRRDRNVPHLPGHERMGFLSDLRNDDPYPAERIANELESILYLREAGNLVTMTTRTVD